MAKAKNKKHFTEAWLEHFSYLYPLAHSLPTTEAVEFLKAAKELEKFIEIAAEHTYGEEKKEA